MGNGNLDNLKKRIERRLREKRRTSRMVIPDPAPRYDEVFFRGRAWLDRRDTVHPAIEDLVMK